MFTIGVILFFATTVVAQEQQKSFTINFGLSAEGYGYPNYLHQQTKENSIPSLHLYGEYFSGKLFSIGLYGAYTYDYFKHYDVSNPNLNYKDSWKGWDLGLRYSFHLSPALIKTNKLDLYAAGFTGYTNRSMVYDKKNITSTDFDYSINAFSIGGIVGGRYFISKLVGFYGEVGISRNTFFGLGVTYRISPKKTALPKN